MLAAGLVMGVCALGLAEYAQAATKQPSTTTVVQRAHDAWTRSVQEGLDVDTETRCRRGFGPIGSLRFWCRFTYTWADGRGVAGRARLRIRLRQGSMFTLIHGNFTGYVRINHRWYGRITLWTEDS